MGRIYIIVKCVCSENVKVQTFICEQRKHAEFECQCFIRECQWCLEEDKCVLMKAATPLDSSLFETFHNVVKSQDKIHSEWMESLLSSYKCELCDTRTCNVHRGPGNEIFCPNCAELVPFRNSVKKDKIINYILHAINGVNGSDEEVTDFIICLLYTSDAADE